MIRLMSVKKLWPLFIWQALACFLAFGQEPAPAPARVVTSYALTSVLDIWASFDPAAWRLLASNDGHTWNQLDERVNQQSSGAGSRRVFTISNQTAYRIYRLQVDADVANADKGVALAEIELMGPVVGVAKETDLQAQITSSQEHPLLGAAVNAFDGDIETKWLDYAPYKDGGCWIQCEYVRRSEMLMTNVSQLRMVTRLMATPTLLLEKSPQILSNLTASATKSARTLVGYALTSANDIPARDPSDWALLGSNDGGLAWETVDIRRNEIFSSRLHRWVFKLAKPSNFALYRLQIQPRPLAGAMQLAEVEPLYSDQEPNAHFSMVISASGENPPMEKTEMAFDHDNQSKWLCFVGAGVTNVWIQWQCLPKVEGLPLINLDQFNRLVNRGKNLFTVPPPGSMTRTMTSYSFVSANDEPSRDPRDWRLLGANQDGTNWETLDVRQNEQFPSRGQKRTFTLAHPKAFARYRLQFDSVWEPTNANSIQLADMEPVYADDPANEFSLVVSARGEHPPDEMVEKLFDGDGQTKWLDFAENDRRSSWVQWYFAPKGKQLVIRADSSLGIQPALTQILTLRMEGIVVCADSNSLGFLDRSGFQMFQFKSPIPEVKPGDRVRLSGGLRFGKEFPLVEAPDLVVLGSLVNGSKFRSVQNVDGQIPFIFDSVTGAAGAVSEGPLYSTLRLVPENGSHRLMVKILNPHHVPLPALAGRRLRVRGVIEPVYDEQGRPYPGVLWVAGADEVTVLPSLEPVRSVAQLGETNELTSIHQIIEAYQNQPDHVFRAKVRGVITFVDLGLGGWYLQNGPDAIFVQMQLASGVNPYLRLEGMYVEVQGTIGGANGLGIIPLDFAKILGKGQMPEPLRASMDDLLAGNCDGKWVQLDGVVTAFEKQRLWLRVNGGQLVVWVNETDWKGEDRMLGSFVRVSGVCAPLNSGQQRLGVRLLVPSADWVETLEASPENPFNLPTSTIDRLLQPDPRAPRLRTPFRKITGVVTYKESQTLFVQTNSLAVRVFLRDEAEVAPGDVVEVVGVPALDGLMPKLVQAVIKKNGRAPLPVANPIDVQQWTADDYGINQDGTRSVVEATLLGLSANESVQILELQQDATDIPFRAYLPRDPQGLFSLPVGSRVRLEGVVKDKADAVPDFGQVVSSFEMYLNSPADILVLARPSWWTSRHTFWLLGGLGLVLFAALTWIGSLRTQVHRRTRELHVVIEQHEKTEVQLQAEISERKRMEIEVEKSHKALIDTSRQAGMAEVATSILHNVGNVLNSVNIASTIVADNLRKSSCANLTKVVTLMNDHAADLGAFMTTDAKGRLIPSYLAQLAAHLDQERMATLSEVDGLKQNVEHIKEVVAMQQTYARVTGLTEVVEVAGLIDAALHADVAVLNCEDVKIVREVDPGVSSIIVDKHKVVQILVNLISNAKHACEDADRKDKLITVRVRQDHQRVLVSVCDNGVGIHPKNLTKIFNHGFTTRKDGHGFGLHSGALAAKELGGSLTAHSEGEGLGATFMLELPLQPPKAVS
jgi:signal transduction histidine kinase